MEDAKYPDKRAAGSAAGRTPGCHKSSGRFTERATHARRRRRYEGLGMTKLVMMWLFGVPVSVLLLFMIFGVL